MKKVLFVALVGISITVGVNGPALAGSVQLNGSASADARFGVAPQAAIAGASGALHQEQHRVVRSTRHVAMKANHRVTASAQAGVKVGHRMSGQVATIPAHVSSNAGTNINTKVNAQVNASNRTSVERQQSGAAETNTQANTGGQAQVNTQVQLDAGINAGMPVQAAVGVAGNVGAGVSGLLR